MKVHYLRQSKRQNDHGVCKFWAESWFDDGGRVRTVQRLNLYLARPDRKVCQHRARLDTVQRDTERSPGPIRGYRHYRWCISGGVTTGNWGESELEPLVPSSDDQQRRCLMRPKQPTTKHCARWSSTASPGHEHRHFISRQQHYEHPRRRRGAGRCRCHPPGDLSQLRERINDYIVRIAQLSPSATVFPSDQPIASAATQTADDSQFVAKVAAEAVALGNAWEDVMYIAPKTKSGIRRRARPGPAPETSRQYGPTSIASTGLVIDERRAAVVKTGPGRATIQAAAVLGSPPR